MPSNNKYFTDSDRLISINISYTPPNQTGHTPGNSFSGGKGKANFTQKLSMGCMSLWCERQINEWLSRKFTSVSTQPRAELLIELLIMWSLALCSANLECCLKGCFYHDVIRVRLNKLRSCEIVALCNFLVYGCYLKSCALAVLEFDYETYLKCLNTDSSRKYLPAAICRTVSKIIIAQL